MQFENLKLALTVLYSNYSTVLNEIRKYYIKHRFLGSQIHDTFTTYGSFEIKIHNNFISDITITRKGVSLIFSVNSEKFDCNYCRFVSSTCNVKIDDVKDNTDWFSLSTIRDFYDINYKDIEMFTNFLDDVNKIKNEVLKDV